MQPRSTPILVLLAGLLFGFIWFFERHQHPGGGLTALAPALPGLRPASVTRVQVRPANSVEFAVERTNGAWMLTRPVVYPAEAEPIEMLLKALGQMSTQSRLTGEEVRRRKDSAKEFGFEPPRFSVVLRQGEEITQILVGKSVPPLADTTFIQIVGTEGVFLADARLLALLPASADPWRSRRLVDLPGSPFDRVTVTNGAKSFDLERATSGRWRLAPPLEARANRALVDTLLSQVKDTIAAGFVADPTAPELEAMGLQPPTLSLTFWRGTNTLATLHFGNSLTNDPSLIFARNDRWRSALLVAGTNIAGWRAPVTEFRDARLVSVAPQEVASVEFRGPTNFTIVQVTNGVWQATGTNSFTPDADLVFDCLATLSAIRAVQFKEVVTPLEFQRHGLEAPAREIWLQIRGAGTNSTQVQLAFSTNHTNLVFARRSDEKSLYGYEWKDVLKLPVVSWQLRDRQIWSFDETNAVRLTIERGTNRLDLLRDGPNIWVLPTNAPAGVNDLALDAVVNALGHCKVLSWVARGAEALPHLGFTPRSLRLTVTFRDNSKRTLTFGGTSPRGFLLASAEVDGQPMVFEFPSDLLQDLATYLRLPPPKE